MASANPLKRILSIVLLIAGAALIVIALALDVMKSSFGLRGAMLIIGIWPACISSPLRSGTRIWSTSFSCSRSSSPLP